jgi:hypothetical protein
MEPLIVLALLVALGLLAIRRGVDSRERPGAHEERLAGLGLSWDGSGGGDVGPGAPAYQPEPGRRRIASRRAPRN